MIKYASEIKKQQLAAARRKARRTKKSSLKGASKQMAESMSEKQLKDFAKTKRKNLPKRVQITGRFSRSINLAS